MGKANKRARQDHIPYHGPISKLISIARTLLLAALIVAAGYMCAVSAPSATSYTHTPSVDSTTLSLLSSPLTEPSVRDSIDLAILEMSSIEDIPASLLHGVVRIESAYTPSALGPPIRIPLSTGEWVTTRAVGLGQVIPEYWLGVYPECGSDLTHIFTNICYTTLILKHYLSTSPSLSAALLRYNGCYSPHCSWYAPSVLGLTP